MGALGMYHQIMVRRGSEPNEKISIGNELAFVVYALSQTYQKANLRGAAIMVTGMIALLQLYFLFFQFTYDSPRYLIMKEDIDSVTANVCDLLFSARPPSRPSTRWKPTGRRSCSS